MALYYKDKTGAVIPISSNVDLSNYASKDSVNNLSSDVTRYVRKVDTEVIPHMARPSNGRSDEFGLVSGADILKLDGIEAGAQKNTVTSVNGKTGAVTVTEGITRSTADSLYLTKTSAQSTYQPKGDYVTATQLSQKGYADAAALANKQDKIKIVSTAPTTSSTAGDPDGTIYLVVG